MCKSSFGRTVRYFITSSIVVFCLVVLSDVLVGRTEKFFRLIGYWQDALPICAAIFVLLVVACVLGVRSNRGPGAEYLTLFWIVLASLGHIFWVFTFDSVFGSDFGAYWNCGLELAATPDQLPRCRGLYYTRSILYTYPIHFLFGDSRTALELVNVAFIILATLFTYFAGEKLIGARAASLAVVLFSLEPEIWYATTLPSHDIPALFWLSLFFLATAQLHHFARRGDVDQACRAKVLALAGGTGLLVFILELQRSYGALCLIALLGYVTVCSWSVWFGRRQVDSSLAVEREGSHHRGGQDSSRTTRIRRVLTLLVCFFIVPWIVSTFSTKVFWQLSAQHNPGAHNWARIFSGMDVHGSNRYSEVAAWRHQYYPSIPTDRQNEVAMKKLIHEFSGDSSQLFRHWQRKNRVLGADAGYLGFSNRPAPEGSALQVNRQNVRPQLLIATSISLFVTLFVVARLIAIPILPLSESQLIVTFFSLVAYSVLLIIGEVQPRYDVFLVFINAWLGAQIVVELFSGRWAASTAMTSIRCVGRFLFCGACGLMVLLGTLLTTLSFLRGSSLTFIDQSGFSVSHSRAEGSGQKDQPSIVIIEDTFKRLTVAYPPGVRVPAKTSMVIEREFSAPLGGLSNLSFFLSPRLWRQEVSPWASANIVVEIFLNGKRLIQEEWGSVMKAKYYSFAKDDLEFGPDLKLQVVITNHNVIEPLPQKVARRGVLSLEFLDLR